MLPGPAGREHRCGRLRIQEGGFRQLVVDATVQAQLFTEVALQSQSLHSRTPPLDRIQDINAGLDEIGDRLADGTLTVQEHEGHVLRQPDNVAFVGESTDGQNISSSGQQAEIGAAARAPGGAIRSDGERGPPGYPVALFRLRLFSEDYG